MEAKAEKPAHAQRIDSLLSADKARARCRKESRKESIRCGARCGAGGGRRQVTAAHAMCLTLQIGSGQRGAAHPEHVAKVCDAGDIEAERLIERIRVLPRVERGAYGARGRSRRRQAAGDRDARACRAQPDCKYGSGQRGGAHTEHVPHVCDAGGVPAERLIERPRPLPRVETGQTVRGEVRTGRQEARYRQPRCTHSVQSRMQIYGSGHGGRAPGTCHSCL